MATTTVHQTTPIQQPEQKLHRHRSFHYDQRHSHHNNNNNSGRHHQVQQVGNYIIYKKTLGSGSMGTVKLAECLSDKDHQLVKKKSRRVEKEAHCILFVSMQSKLCPR